MISITNINCGVMSNILKHGSKATSRSSEHSSKKKKKHKPPSTSGNPTTDKSSKGDPVAILNNVIDITKELNQHVINITNQCEQILDEQFMSYHNLENTEHIQEDPHELALVNYLLSHKEIEQEHHDVIEKIENLRLSDERKKNEKLDKSEQNEIKPKNERPPSPPPECSHMCSHNHNQSWTECASKVNENIKNSYKVSYNKIRMVNLFKSFTF